MATAAVGVGKDVVMNKPKVAFICTHNSCRSQMAEALARLLAADVFEAYSAGTELKASINPDAVRCIKRLYGVDMEAAGQHPKLIDALPLPDIVVTMGCGVECPWLPSRHREDWGLDDPTGGEDALFDETAKVIEQKVLDLKKRILVGLL
jgi:arsenate reductase (thioredoxin)